MWNLSHLERRALRIKGKRQRRRAICAGAAALISATVPSVACSPSFPNEMFISLASDDRDLLAAPVGDLRIELRRIKSPAVIPFKFVPPKEGDNGVRQTADADLEELTAALAASDIAATKSTEALRAYRFIRDAYVAHAQAVAKWHREVGLSRFDKTIKVPPEPIPPELNIPADLPGEFADYLSGAVAFHSGRTEQARAFWQHLLARPEKERHYRSTWAEFMLGKTGEDADDQITHLRNVREMTLAGFADSLGLATASYGWEAKTELARKNFSKAIELYLLQMIAGDRTAEMSLRDTVRIIFNSDAKALRDLAADRSSRQVLTAYVVSNGGPFQDNGPDDKSKIAWLAAVEAAGVKDVDEADRLAWAAYQGGRFDLAKRWLKLAPDEAPMALWVSAKLQLRDGHTDLAAQTLAKAMMAFPANDEWFPVAPDDAPLLPAAQTRAELGLLKMARGQYIEAMDLLLASDHWTDAAFIAERVLTPDELKQYVNQKWGIQSTVPSKDEPHLSDWSRKLTPSRKAIQIRGLLARRLTRLGRWKEAREYFSPALQLRLDAYITALQDGSNASKTADEKATSLWEAAKIARHEGMELLGTEGEPDNHADRGNFEVAGQYASRLVPTTQMTIAPSSVNERQRLSMFAEVQPVKRFHYRYIAADHAWAAAALMPDHTDATAQVLYEAGCWLKDRDAPAADRFYKALVRRCGDSTLGMSAAKLHWFPKPEK